MPSGTFPAPAAGPQQGQGSGYFPAPPRNGAVPEAATEQMPRIPPAPGRAGTGSHPVPFPPSRTGFGPVPTGPEQRNGLAPERYPDEYPELDEDGPGGDFADYPDYPDEDDVEPDEYVEDDDLADEGPPSPGREWLIMAGQVAVSVVGGAAVWLGFNWLWGRFPQAALIAALAVIVGLVWIVRRIRRADDLQTTGLAVLVGLFVTVSPAALILLSR
jgi:hypothetical protein